jgi:hypothetical protein
VADSPEDLERLDAYTYLTVRERVTYLSIMRLFTASLMTDLSAQQVVEVLATDGFALPLDAAVSRLNQLVNWGNLLPSSHTVRVKSIEEYQRTRSRYQLFRDRAEHHVESHVTLRELRELSPMRVAPQTVYVCENPRVLEAAAQACTRVAMVCTLGNPTTVTLSLLEQLASVDGVHLAYHGDFDWPGIAIAGRVMRRIGGSPWRFRAADYGGGTGDAEPRNAPAAARRDARGDCMGSGSGARHGTRGRRRP